MHVAPLKTRIPNLRKNNGEERGDLLIRGLWANGTVCFDVQMTDTDAAW
jgi:hypothetical protein